jgi:prepilin peptidase CpaA
MATQLTVPMASTEPAGTQTDDSLGIDRAFLMSMARIPLVAVAWVVVAWVASIAWPLVGTMQYGNLGPMIVLAGGMILAAIIDGWAFKVPNWVTLSLVVSGWYLGILHDCGIQWVPGLSAEMSGGLGASLMGTLIGFALLFPILFIQGMGQGDVKMQMGFGSWCGALFGLGVGASVVLWAFCVGAMVGGVFGLVMMIARRQFGKNKENFAAIMGDLQTLMSEGPTKAAARANSRRASWVRLPYGVPLCVGFLGYLWYRFILTA